MMNTPNIQCWWRRPGTLVRPLLLAVAGSVGGLLGRDLQAQNDPAAVARAANTRPNIIFFYADDLGYGDLACYGSKVAQTPHLDQLAKEGTRFTQFYVSHAVCSPTRASALTGHFPSQHRIFGHLNNLEANAARGMPNWLDVQAPSLPRAMQQAGYRSAIFGKWHLGGGSGRTFRGKPINSADAPSVLDYGFDAARITFGNGPTWRGTQAVDQPHDIYPYEDPGLQTWSSKLIAEATNEFLDRHSRNRKDQPFMVNVWFSDPHTPLKPTDEMRAPFRHLSEPSQTHYASIGEMDRQIGRVLLKLDELGMRDNTLVLFTSDNGATHTGGGSNGPLRGFKHALREGGIREPFIARWPGKVRPGRVDESSVLSLVDFAPTFCRLAGAQMPQDYQPDGIDMTQALLGESIDRSRPLFWHHPKAAPAQSPTLAMRDGRWKLTMNPDGTKLELFDLVADIAETTDVSAANPQIVARMKENLLKWHATLPAPEAPQSQAK